MDTNWLWLVESALIKFIQKGLDSRDFLLVLKNI